jgi:dTDP-4-dehydrorhamnose reductase
VSTDYVFDGTKDGPYVEWDPTGPQSVYGASKLGGEHEVAEHAPGACTVRTSWVCGEHGKNMVKTVLGLADRPELAFVDDQRGCPSFTADLAVTIRSLAVSRVPGVFHVTNQGVASWYEFVRDILAAAGHDPAKVRPIASVELDPPRPAPRPANSVLDNAALRAAGFPLLPHYRESLGHLVKTLTG